MRGSHVCARWKALLLTCPHLLMNMFSPSARKDTTLQPLFHARGYVKHNFLAGPLSPPSLTRGQMGLHDIRIQFNTEPGLVGYLDVSVLDIRLVELEHLIHPATLAGNGLQGYVVANGGCPLSGRIRVNLGTGIMVGHRQPEQGRHVGDTLGFQKAAGIAQVRVQDVRSPGR